MPLNQCEADFFDKVATEQNEQPKPEKPLSELTLEELRESEAFFEKYLAPAKAVPTQNFSVPVRDGACITTRVFNSHLADDSPILIMYPGCGYFLHLFDINAAACSRIAEQLDCKVAIMDIRVAPESPLPTAIYDAYDVTQYIVEHADEFGIDPTQLFTGGMSSGAHCASSVAYLLSQEKKHPFDIKHQFLLNGFYDYSTTRKSFADHEAKDALCQRDVTPAVIPLYGLEENELSSPLISPINNPNMAKLPPTTLLVAEFDGLRSDSEDYFEALQKQGADAERILLPGQTHNTFLLRDIMHEGIDPAGIIANKISELLQSPSNKIKTRY